MIVALVALVDAVRRRRDPSQIGGEPLPDRGFVPQPIPSVFQYLHRAGYFDQMHRVDHADAASGVHADDRLRIAQIGGHRGRRIDEPGVQEPFGMASITGIAGHAPCGGQCRYGQAQRDHGVAMRVELFRVRQAVASHIGAARMLRIRPPIIGFRLIIVGAARTARRPYGRDRAGVSAKPLRRIGQ